MELLINALTTIASSGLPGAACIVLSFVVFFLWRDGKNERASHKAEMVAAQNAHKAEIEKHRTQISELDGYRIADWKEMSAARLGDAQTLHKQMLEVVKQCTSVMESTAASLDAHKEVTVEHRDAQKQAAEELRKLSTLLHGLSEEIRHRIRPR